MKKWYDEEYEWEIEVIGFNKDKFRLTAKPLGNKNFFEGKFFD